MDDSLNKNPFFVAGCTFIWLVVIPLTEKYLRKYKFISAIDALGNSGITLMRSFWIFGTGGASSLWGLPILRCSIRVWTRLNSMREMKMGFSRMFWRFFKTLQIPSCVFWTSFQLSETALRKYHGVC